MPSVKDYVAHSWVSLATVKREHYRALSHYHVACGLLTLLNKKKEKKGQAPKPPAPKSPPPTPTNNINNNNNNNNNNGLHMSNRTRDTLQYIHAPLEEDDTKIQLEIRVPRDEAECKLLGI